jgi:hypothetical protein
LHHPGVGLTHHRFHACIALGGQQGAALQAQQPADDRGRIAAETAVLVVINRGQGGALWLGPEPALPELAGQQRQQAHQAHPGEQAQFQNGQKAEVHAGQQTNPDQAWGDRTAGPDQQQWSNPLDQLGAAAEQLQQARKASSCLASGQMKLSRWKANHTADPSISQPCRDLWLAAIQ